MVGASRFGGQVPLEKGHNQKETSSPEAIRLYSDGFTADPAPSPTRRHDKELLLTRRDGTLLLSRSRSASKLFILHLSLFTKLWSGRADLNGRPPAPKALKREYLTNRN